MKHKFGVSIFFRGVDSSFSNSATHCHSGTTKIDKLFETEMCI
jgi:hypothetical protein